MAINFNTTLVSGLTKSTKLDMTTINETNRSIDFSATVNSAKDPIYIVVDLKDAHINTRLEMLNEEGNIVNVITLMSKGISIVPITTYGFITKDGQLNFKLTGMSGDIESDFGIEVGAFSYTPVINK